MQGGDLGEGGRVPTRRRTYLPSRSLFLAFLRDRAFLRYGVTPLRRRLRLQPLQHGLGVLERRHVLDDGAELPALRVLEHVAPPEPAEPRQQRLEDVLV